MDCVSHARPPKRTLIIDGLQHAAESSPDGIFQAGRDLTHAGAWAQTGAIASWLVAQGFGPQSAPVAILSGDSLERALFFCGCLRAGVRVASLSPDLSLPEFDRALEFAKPALVFAQDSRGQSAALDRAQSRAARIVTVDGKRGLAFAALAACSIDASVAERRLHITADTPAEIGVTGSTSGILSTHGTLAQVSA
jgi:feruloyl-CoA synthase